MAIPSPTTGRSSPLIRQLSALVDLVREISRARAAQEIYEPALSALNTILGVERSSILLLDSGGVARFLAWRGLSDTYRHAVEGHFPWSLDDPDPRAILIEDVELDETLTPLFPIFRAERIRSVAFIPLMYGERLVGKFMMYYEQPHRLASEDLELANAVAYLVAFAIERARLYAALEESDRRKDIFLATLAHELRNPLAPAAASLELMEHHPEDVSTVRMARGVLERSIGQIARLVDDLLDVSRITRGVIVLEKAPVEVSSLVHHAISTLQGQITAKHQELTLSLEPLWVEADALRLEQVITNLVHNAIKYTPRGGHIRVATAPREGGVEIVIRDDGIGIDPATLPRLFDLFVQVDQSLARTQGGLGIGLTIVRKLAELHGGTVSATSEGEGRGSEFTVWLPGRIDRPRPTPPSATPAAHAPRRRVLIVDDNEDATRMLSMLLSAWGHDVATAGDGPTALAAVQAQHPEILLLDLGLPGMSGYEVATRLREAGETDLQIVAVSGYGQPEDVARAHAAGFDAHLTKPVDRAELERVLAGGRA
ncbi:MAG: domain S-box-containing protein [Myxococcales bacterium]|nr:domain S-box-containing protein [Myxococcales bacterium]